MLVLLRIVAMALFIVVSCLFGLLVCLLRPFHSNNVHVIARWFGKMSYVLGVKLVITRHPESEQAGPAIYVANHQNNYDLFTLPAAVPKNTVSMGKQSIKWIPFFGQMYWLSGNILINRTNRSQAMGALDKSVGKIKQQGLSVWMFPEGTRSYGRGLLPFKTGAFHTAMNADVPVIPVCMNTTHNCIKLNRWDNGTIYIDMLAPVHLNKETSARDHAGAVQALMRSKIAELDVKMREKNGKLARN